MNANSSRHVRDRQRKREKSVRFRVTHSRTSTCAIGWVGSEGSSSIPSRNSLSRQEHIIGHFSGRGGKYLYKLNVSLLLSLSSRYFSIRIEMKQGDESTNSIHTQHNLALMDYSVEFNNMLRYKLRRDCCCSPLTA
jgi:hypothetical protein